MPVNTPTFYQTLSWVLLLMACGVGQQGVHDDEASEVTTSQATQQPAEDGTPNHEEEIEEGSPHDGEVDPWHDPNPPRHVGGGDLVGSEVWQRLLQAEVLVAQRLNSDVAAVVERELGIRIRRAIRAVLRQGQLFQARLGKRCGFAPGVALVAKEDGERVASLELCFSCSDMQASSEVGPMLYSDFGQARSRLLRLLRRVFQEDSQLEPIPTGDASSLDPWSEVNAN